jgi:hypothetical protein
MGCCPFGSWKYCGYTVVGSHLKTLLSVSWSVPRSRHRIVW